MTATVDQGSVICPKTEMIRAYCAHCRDIESYNRSIKTEARQRNRVRKEPLLGRWFRAAYWGACSRCGERFEAGEDIRGDYPEGSGWIRRACHESARPRRGSV